MDDSILSDEPAEFFLANFIEDCECAIAEIIRLQDFLPKDFIQPERSRFNLLISDFSYFNKPEILDAISQKHPDLEEDFYSKFGDVLRRFEILFHTIANLFHQFIEYTELASKELYSSRDATRELEVDALAHLASISYHIHKIYTGPTRERIFVAILRVSDDRKNLDFLVDFLRGDVYPYHGTNELVFARTKLDKTFIQSCLTFLERTIRTTPDRLPRIGHRLPEVVFGCLLFSTETRAIDGLRMKFFVENFFRDNWVIPLSLGLCISVVDEWTKSPAAFSVCQNHFVGSRLQQLFKEHDAALHKKEYTASDIVPEKFEVLIDWIQRLNTSYRWMVLHTGPFTRFGKQLISQPENIAKFQEKHVDMAIKLANFEADFLDIYGTYIKERKTNTQSLLEELCALLQELSDLFSGNTMASKLEKKEKLCEWLGNLKNALKELNPEDPESYDVLSKIKRKLCQVVEILDLRKNLAVSHFIEVIIKKIDSLAAAVSSSKSGEERLKAIAQSSYLWPLVDEWVPHIQARLLVSTRTQPVRVLFRKLELSINGVSSPFRSDEKKDLISRAYSCFLEKRLRNVLQSVPNYLFQLLREKVIPALQKKWDPVIEKTAMKELADFSENMQLSEVTHSISNMSVGVSRFSLKKIGTITVNPKKLLEEGIRRELGKELPKLLWISDKEYKIKNFDLEVVLNKNSTNLAAFHRAFIYLCEHLGVEGHHLWWEELEDQMSEVDCSTSVLPKSGESLPLVNVAYIFLLKLTDPTTSTYFQNEIVWKERKTNKEILSSRTTDLIERWVPSMATTVTQKAIVGEMRSLLKDIFTTLKSTTSGIGALNVDSFLSQKEYEQIVKEFQYASYPCGIQVAKVGQLALIYSLLLQSKMEAARVKATILYDAVQATNRSILCNTKALPSSTSTVITLSQRLGLVSSKIKLPVSGHIPFNVRFSLLAVIIANSSRIGTKNGFLCETSFTIGIRLVAEHLNSLEEFLQSVRKLKEIQGRTKKFKYSVDDAVLTKILG